MTWVLIRYETVHSYRSFFHSVLVSKQAELVCRIGDLKQPVGMESVTCDKCQPSLDRSKREREYLFATTAVSQKGQCPSMLATKQQKEKKNTEIQVQQYRLDMPQINTYNHFIIHKCRQNEHVYRLFSKYVFKSHLNVLWDCICFSSLGNWFHN